MESLRIEEGSLPRTGQGHGTVVDAVLFGESDERQASFARVQHPRCPGMATNRETTALRVVDGPETAFCAEDISKYRSFALVFIDNVRNIGISASRP